MATQGLFNLLGATPEEIRSKYEQGLMGAPISSVPLESRPAAMGAGLGRQLGYSIGRMLGGRVPGEAEAEARQQAMQQAQAEGATGSALYQALAEQLAAAGDTRGAMMASEQARTMAQQEEAAQVGLALKKAQLEEAQAKAQADPKVARAQELLKTGKYKPESVALFQATSDANVLDFKDPDKTKLEKFLDANDIQGEQRQKFIMAAIKKETEGGGNKLLLDQLKLFQAQTDLQIAQLRLSQDQLKIEQGKQAEVYKNVLSVADASETLDFIERSRNVLRTGTGVSGIAGQISRDILKIEELPANILDSYYQTLKAKIGFAELNKMREASPTGGALGQVTERELAFLQAVRGKLSVGLPKEVQLAALKQIETSIRVLSYIKNKVDKGEKIPDNFIKQFYPKGVPTKEEILASIGEAPTDAEGAVSSGTVQAPDGRKPLSAF